MRTRAVILAAGQGTRMRSSQPKVMHPLMGLPLVWYALNAAQIATGGKPTLVIGHGADQVRQWVVDAAMFAFQEQQLGTGHAVLQAESLIHDKTDFVLVTTADMPLLTSETLSDLILEHSKHASSDIPVTFLTIITEDSRGFGRVIRDQKGEVISIVEEALASAEQLAIQEYNASVYCFNANWLWPALKRLQISPKGEYYLTDIIALAIENHLNVRTMTIADPDETIGINTRIHLAEATKVLRERINSQWMLSGVTIIDPLTTYIEPGVEIGQDTVIWPNTYLQSNTSIGQSCSLGPNTILRASSIGDHCEILSSVVEGATIENLVHIGPFARLRKGAHLAEGVHMGNFGEVKNSYLGPGTKVGHFSYLGDTTTGPDVNIGAGTITCNYDGERKYPTEIGANAFIGSDTMLVAPLKVGEGARTGAGSVVTKDIPPYTLAVGTPARAIRRLDKSDRS
jgi:bifunctional UDP-N-acetylglucosamine pyrophosphorylase/glucosamine-1-phosphate N-acetyltransferase